MQSKAYSVQINISMHMAMENYSPVLEKIFVYLILKITLWCDSFVERHSILKPHPPVVEHVSHHNIHLSWDREEQRKGPQEQWLQFSVEEEDPKLHKYGLIYT